MSLSALAFAHSCQKARHRFAYSSVGVRSGSEFGPRWGQEYPQDARPLPEREAPEADRLQDFTSLQLRLVLDRWDLEQVRCQDGSIPLRSACRERNWIGGVA